MPRHRTSIAIPQDLLAEVDAAARERNELRSAFITRLLHACVGARRDRDITRRLDALLADPPVPREDDGPDQLADLVLGDEHW